MKIAVILGILFHTSTFSVFAQNSEKIIEGGITFKISTSWTAQVFHMVDQLSKWNEYAHPQYMRWAKKKLLLNKTDTIILNQHAALRKIHQNYTDFEQSFLVNGSIENAASAAMSAGRLSSEEAIKEQAVLTYFSKRLAVLQDTATAQANSFYKNLAAHQNEMNASIQKIRHFTETKGKVVVPVFLVVNPENGSGGGGEANGGILVVETQKKPDSFPFFIHESLHFLLNPHEAQIKSVSDSAQVDWEVVNEGIAYAMQGLIGDTDLLPNTLVRNIAQGKSIPNQYTKFGSGSTGRAS